MKKILFTLLLLLLPLLVLAQPFGSSPFGPIPPDNTPYNAATWDGDLRVPTKNVVRDQIESMISAVESAIHTKSFTINVPDASDDFLIWRISSAITVTHIYGVLQSGTNVIGGLDECDEDGLNPVAVDADITFDGGLDGDDGALTNPGIATGNWLKWHTTSVSTPGYLTVTIYFTVD